MLHHKISEKNREKGKQSEERRRVGNWLISSTHRIQIIASYVRKVGHKHYNKIYVFFSAVRSFLDDDESFVTRETFSFIYMIVNWLYYEQLRDLREWKVCII